MNVQTREPGKNKGRRGSGDGKGVMKVGDTATTVEPAATATVEDLEAQGARAAQAVARCDEEIAALHDRRRRLSLDVVSGDAVATEQLAGIHAEVARLQADRQLAQEAVEEAARRVTERRQADEDARRAEVQAERGAANADVEAALAALTDAAAPAAEAVVRLLAAGDRRQAAEYLLGFSSRSHRRELAAEAEERLKLIFFEAGAPILGDPTRTFQRRDFERRQRERQLAELAAAEAATVAAAVAAGGNPPAA